MTTPHAVIFGCAGPDLTAKERDFFRDADPLGFILFARNIDTPDRACRLVDELRSSVARAEAPVLIDQEGGRVARLRPPHWRKAPPARLFGELYARDPALGLEAVGLNARLLAADLASVGADVDCLPVLDLALPETHAAIGDRAYSDRPEAVAALGRAAAEGLLAEGVMPVIKHMPGHGRATIDSHLALPKVTAPLDLLGRTDFLPFKLLSDLPWGMTAHLLFETVDPQAPITVSARGVKEIIRGHVGFDGLLLTDDLSMQALGGSLGERAERALAAGCDIALHCNGRMDEMVDIITRTGPMTEIAEQRLQAGREVLKRHLAPAGRAGLAAPRLVVGLDGSTHADAAVASVAARAWPKGTEVRLVTALDDFLLGVMDPLAAVHAGKMLDDETKWAQEIGAAAAEKLRAAGLVADAVIRPGDPRSALLGEAEKWGADALHVGARGLRGIERLLLGSVSSGVAERATCSVEVIR